VANTPDGKTKTVEGDGAIAPGHLNQKTGNRGVDLSLKLDRVSSTWERAHVGVEVIRLRLNIRWSVRKVNQDKRIHLQRHFLVHVLGGETDEDTTLDFIDTREMASGRCEDAAAFGKLRKLIDGRCGKNFII